MASRYEIKVKSDGLSIRIKPEQSLLNSIVSLLAAFFLLALPKGMGWPDFIYLGLFALLICNFVWNELGEEKIEVGSADVEITSRVLFLSRTRRFAKETVESLAYRPRANRSPAVIRMTLKNRLLPFRFAQDLDPDEANTLLQAFRTNISWMAEKIKPVPS